MDDRPSLLIVDDERGPAESLRMIFKPSYHVHTASGGEQALEILHSTPVDVVTLDLRMPGMPGTEVMERIKRFDPDIEIIVVTGYASLDSAIRGLRVRVFDYVTKPFDVPQIIDLVRRAVTRRRATLRVRHIEEDFLANLSHELRTPLSAIIGYNAILSEELRATLNDEQRVALDRIEANSQELLNLVECVLLLNSLDAGDVTASISSFDVRESLQRTIHQFASAAEQRDLTLSIEAGTTPLWLISDQHKLERVLWALIDNAVKSITHGSIVLAARPTRDGTALEIEVQQTGIALDADELSRLIESLTETDPSSRRRQRGLELGLRMASRLTEFLGGSLDVRSTPGAGTQFTVTLPTHRDEGRHNGHHDA